MARNTSKKKMSRKMKRTIRKTSAAVLLAAAIAVAAVPVDQSMAIMTPTQTGTEHEDTRTRFVAKYPTGYPVTDDRTPKTSGIANDSASSDSGSTYYKNINAKDLAKYHQGTITDDDLEKALFVRQDSDNAYNLNWQFKFADGILYQYNSEFSQDIVTLNYRVATEYYMVSQTDYEGFFATSPQTDKITYAYDNGTHVVVPLTIDADGYTVETLQALEAEAYGAEGAQEIEAQNAVEDENTSGVDADSASKTEEDDTTSKSVKESNDETTEASDDEGTGESSTGKQNASTLSSETVSFEAQAEIGAVKATSDDIGGISAYWYDDQEGLSSAAYFMQNYFAQQYAVFVAECQAYYQYSKDYDVYKTETNNYKNYLQALKDYNLNGGVKPNLSDYCKNGVPVEPTPVKYPTTMSYSPSQIDVSYQGRYFCEHAKAKGSTATITNYFAKGVAGALTTEVVYDMTDPAHLNNNKTYMIRFTDPNAEPDKGARKDGYGFLITDFSDVPITAIGDYAFEGVKGVNTLNLPTEIKRIGDYAFSSSFMSKINMVSVSDIGNAAFKNCRKLDSVVFETDTVSRIGAEAFANCISLESITLPSTITDIGAGAFSGCSTLSRLDLSKIQEECRINDFAFWDCRSLAEVPMADQIAWMGEAVFGVSAGDLPLSILLPQKVDLTDAEYLFYNRANLQTVTFPEFLAIRSEVKLPKTMFMGCNGLKYVTFQKDNRFAYYYPEMFMDVNTPDFYVTGPAFATGSTYAKERECTWDAFTWVADYVPYIYEINGVTYYEVSDGEYLLCANEQGELVSVTPIDESKKTPIELVIPKTVGAYTIKSLANGCFANKNLQQRLHSLTVSDGTISILGDDVFNGMPELEWVEIGDSVTLIGNRAFANCPKLTDVTFHSLGSNYAALEIGTDAFKTGSPKLIFHGDIQAGYKPFDWAMDPTNIIDSNGLRVCYQSLAPTYLTVMYDDATSQITLLDYPKYQELDLDHADYCKEMESYYYSVYANSMFNGFDCSQARLQFYKLYKALETGGDVTAAYASSYYGPWVNPSFVGATSNDMREYLKARDQFTDAEIDGGARVEVEENSKTTVLNIAVDALADSFGPLEVNAASTAIPYFSYNNGTTDNSYSIIRNYENPQEEIWKTSTTDELSWIKSTQNIIVPPGVGSIDVASYMDYDKEPENAKNVSVYLTPKNGGILSQAEYNMYTKKTPADASDADDFDSVPGLFSGYYDDDVTAKHPVQTNKRGNDTIESIVMKDVTYLPEYAFDSCEALTTVILGDQLKSTSSQDTSADDPQKIGVQPFRDCNATTTVFGNEDYVYEDGIIYDVSQGAGNYKIVEAVPGRGLIVGGSTLPDPNNSNEAAMIANVDTMMKGAFEDCDGLKVVDLSASSLSIIPERSFAECDLLNRVNLPSTTTSIKSEAFDNDDHMTIQIPGGEVFIATDAMEHGAQAKKDPGTANLTFETYADSAAAEYARYYDIELYEMGKVWSVTFFDYEGTQLGETMYISDGEVIATAERPADPTRAGYTFDGWVANTGIDVGDRIKQNTIFIASYTADPGTHDGTYFVKFYDGVTGELLADLQIAPDEEATPPEVPTHSGYKFLKWSTDEYKKVKGDINVMALYEIIKTNPVTPGGGGNSGGNGGGGNSGGGSSDNGGGGSSNNNSSTKYLVTVNGGTGGGSYAQGSTVVITANAPASGKVFSRWTTNDGVNFTNASLSSTTFSMPNKNVTVTANYIDAATTTTTTTTSTTTVPANTAAPTVTTTAATDDQKPTTNNGNNAQVQVSKPGISNVDAATATVHGSSDSFVIKISETNAATTEVEAALKNKYGSLDNIKYWAMDISLYDATGNTKINDTSGLTVDITIPLPDELRGYGGNNKVGAVSQGLMEELGGRFNTINGTPTVTFTATHFSPYAIYVDTGNLVAGDMIDTTPQTGDGIHPKWFLAIGLAALSGLLFLKKDKKGKVVQPA